MAVSDSISDALTKIRNASSAKRDVVEIKKSKLMEGIVSILKREGFIADYRAIPDNKQGIIRVYLRYRKNKSSYIDGLRRISKPSLRIYRAKEDLPTVRGGIGIAVVSTSQGLLTGKEAKEKGVGGEVLCYAW